MSGKISYLGANKQGVMTSLHASKTLFFSRNDVYAFAISA